MSRPSIHVAITGFGGLQDPDAGTAVARALRQGWSGKITISALGYDSMMTGAWMPGVADYIHLLPPLLAGDAAILNSILEIHSRRKLDVLIPCLEADIPLVARIADLLASEGILTLLPAPESLSRLLRKQLPQFFFEIGIPAPVMTYVENIADVTQIAEQTGFPLLVKGSVSDTRIACTADQAMHEALCLYYKWGGGVMLQQKITGDEYAVAILAGRDGSCRGIVPMRKLAIDGAGLDVCGSVIDDPQLVTLARDMLELLDWRGPLVLEYVRSPGISQPLLCNITHGFPSWVMLTHWAGCNLPVLLIQELLQLQDTDTPCPETGTMYIRSIDETTVPLSDLLGLKRYGAARGPALNGHRRRICGDINLAGDGIRVAVTGTSTFDLVNPGLGVARALRNVPAVSEIFGMNYGTLDSGSYDEDLFDAAFRLPVTSDPEILFECLQKIHMSDPFDVILPCLDGELPHFIELRDAIEALGVATLYPSQSAFDMRSKLALFGNNELFDCHEFKVPASVVAGSEEEVLNAIESIGLPAVIKGPMSGCAMIDSINDVHRVWAQFQACGIYRVIVQARITGDMFAVAAVCDRNHKVLTSLTVKKLARCDHGSTWSALHVDEPELEAGFARYLEKIKWVGPVEGEFIRDEMLDTFYLFEVNPRFTGWISYSGALGSNHPGVAVHAALYKDLEFRENRTDLVFMRSSHELALHTADLASLSVKGMVYNGK
jgi:carbamoyl-phosphate synthase large subunit